MRRVPVRYGASLPMASARKGVRFNSAPGAYSPGRRREHGSNRIRPARIDPSNVGIFDGADGFGDARRFVITSVILFTSTSCGISPLTRRSLPQRLLKKFCPRQVSTLNIITPTTAKFAHKGFLDHVNCADQKITFCAVGAHHQNGIIENKNKILFFCTAYECGRR